MEFRKYMHLERFGTDEVEGIELGECYIFPKIDGTNGSVWLHEGEIQAGSRNRHLTLDNDNAGFLAAMREDVCVRSFLNAYPHLRLYGEWLVPHSLTTYREDAWRKFYVFDVFDGEEALHYSQYEYDLTKFGVECIPPIAVIKNAQYENLLSQLDKNVYLLDDGKGCGEGIVLKNYAFKNRFGRTVWAKMITNSFKEKHVKAMGPSILNGKQMVEQECVDEYVNKHLVDKVYSKIVTDSNGWSSKYIPRLLATTFYDLVNEELWDIVKKHKNPTINFKTLNTLTILKVKEIRPELF